MQAGGRKACGQLGPLEQVWLNSIATSVPAHDIHAAFVEFGRDTIVGTHKKLLFDRMASLADIEHCHAGLSHTSPIFGDRLLPHMLDIY